MPPATGPWSGPTITISTLPPPTSTTAMSVSTEQSAGHPEQRQERLLLVVDDVDLGAGRSLDLHREPRRVRRAAQRLGPDDRDGVGMEIARLADVAAQGVDGLGPMRPEIPVLVDDRPQAEQHGLVDQRPQLVVVDDRSEEVHGV